MTFAAHGDRMQREHNERMALAWHTGALARWPLKSRGVPDFPDLSKLLAKTGTHRRAHRKQTPEEMLAMAKMITVAFGGTVSDKLQ